MRCQKAQSLIISRLAGEMKPSLSQQLGQHLGSCSACRAFEQDQIRLDTMLSAGSIPAFPDHVHARIMAAVSSPVSIKTHNLHYLMRQIPAAAAIIFSLYVGSLVGIKSYNANNESLAQSKQTEEISIDLASFGENSILDEIAYGVSYE